MVGSWASGADLGHSTSWAKRQSPWKGGEICCPLCPALSRASIPVPIISTYHDHMTSKLFGDDFQGLLQTEFPGCPGDGSPAFVQHVQAVPRRRPTFTEKGNPSRRLCVWLCWGGEGSVTDGLSYSELNKRHRCWEVSPGCAAREAQLWVHSRSQRLLEISSDSLGSSSHHPPTLRYW